MDKKIIILYLGLLRTNDIFKKTTKMFNKYNCDIVISTWHSEREKYEDFFTKNKIDVNKIICSDMLKYNGISANKNDVPSNYKGFGYYECGTPCDNTCLLQSVNYDAGIKYINSINQDCFILKMRADVDITESMFNYIIKSITPCEYIFKYKVWVPYVEMTKPFYICSESFFGYIADMLLLNNFKLYKRKTFGQGVSHIRLFMEPFKDTFKDDFYIDKENINFKLTLQNMNWIYDDKDKLNYYANVLYKYYTILDKCFNIKNIENNGFYFRLFKYPKDYANIKYCYRDIINKCKKSSNLHLISDSSWITNVLSGRFNKNDKLMQLIASNSSIL